MEINELVESSYKNALDKGWWEPAKSFIEIVALIHSEASEALEDFRNWYQPTAIYYKTDKDGNQKPCGIPIEFADIIIRICDACGHYGIDLEAAIQEKATYNAKRPWRHGGKAA